MEKSINIKTSDYSQASKISKKNKYDLFIENLNFSYFGLISMTILIGSIIGGIAAAIILGNEAPIWELGLCAAVSMANNTAAIGQAPTKWVFNLFVLSIFVNILMIVMNLF